MQVQFQKKDALNATLSVTISNQDYQPRVESELKKIQRKINIHGFRVGHAPMGLVKKQHGPSVYVDEVNKMASESLFGYLEENKIEILAQPLLSVTLENKIDFDKQEDFEFHFDLGLAPKFDVNITEADTVTSFKITVDEKAINEEIESLKKRFGKMEPVEKAGEKDVIYADVTELTESGEKLEGGIENKSISFVVDLIKNEALNKKFIGVKKGDVLTADIFELFNNNETVLVNTVGVQKEAINDLNKNFEFKITEVQHFIDAEIGQDLFNQVFGEGQVNNEEEFKARIKENLETYYQSESEQHVEHEINHLIFDKHTFDLPEAFLKRWLLETKENDYNENNIDERFGNEVAHLRHSLVHDKIIQKYDVKVENKDIENTSLGYTAQLLRNYGINNPDFETLKKLSDQNLGDKKYVAKMRDIALSRKVTLALKDVVTKVEQEVSIEEFNRIIEEHHHTHHGNEHNHAHDHDHEHEHDHEHAH